MPANLTPQYHKAEAEYRQAGTPEEELRCLEVMLREMPKHKGTDKLQAELKQKISKARQEAEHAKKTGAKKGPSHKIPRQGAGRAVIIGGPNAGKSSLLKALTRATPEVAPYPFTTREPQLGMLSRLWWQSLRDSGWIFGSIYGALALLSVLIMLDQGPVALVWGCLPALIGSFTFFQDHWRQQYRFFSEHGVGPRMNPCKPA